MSTWERNELRQKIAEKLTPAVADPAKAYELAGLAVSAFYEVGSVTEMVETTTLGSAEEQAIRQRFIVARTPVGEVEHLVRPRPAQPHGWKRADDEARRKARTA